MRSSAYKRIVVVACLALAAIVSVRAYARQSAAAAKPAAQASGSQAKTDAQPQGPPAGEPAANLNGPYVGLGTVPTTADMGNLAFASGFKGKDLPEGSGTAKIGADIFAGRCSMCHGANAEGVHWAPMAFSPLHGPRLG